MQRALSMVRHFFLHQSQIPQIGVSEELEVFKQDCRSPVVATASEGSKVSETYE